MDEYECQVARKDELLAAHPEWCVLSPFSLRSVARGERHWRARGPGGQVLRAYELSELLDQIEAGITKKGGDTGG